MILDALSSQLRPQTFYTRAAQLRSAPADNGGLKGLRRIVGHDAFQGAGHGARLANIATCVLGRPDASLALPKMADGAKGPLGPTVNSEVLEVSTYNADQRKIASGYSVGLVSYVLALGLYAGSAPLGVAAGCVGALLGAAVGEPKAGYRAASRATACAMHAVSAGVLDAWGAVGGTADALLHAAAGLVGGLLGALVGLGRWAAGATLPASSPRLTHVARPAKDFSAVQPFEPHRPRSGFQAYSDGVRRHAGGSAASGFVAAQLFTAELARLEAELKSPWLDHYLEALDIGGQLRELRSRIESKRGLSDADKERLTAQVTRLRSAWVYHMNDLKDAEGNSWRKRVEAGSALLTAMGVGERPGKRQEDEKTLATLCDDLAERLDVLAIDLRPPLSSSTREFLESELRQLHVLIAEDRAAEAAHGQAGAQGPSDHDEHAPMP